MPAFKLKDVEEPKFEVEFPDGAVKQYDPWKLQTACFNAHQDAGTDLVAMYDGIRQAFGFPKEAEGVSTLTCNQCLALEAALGDYVDSLPVSKKIAALTLNASSDSPSPK